MASWQVAGVEGTVGGDAGDFLIAWDLVYVIVRDGTSIKHRGRPASLFVCQAKAAQALGFKFQVQCLI